ncbi:MAG: glycoside hydrolase family 13 protein [Culicoidibacterales bacterium]
MVKQTKKWWHDAIVYQVYPRSFFDTNQDGVGDLAGIIEKLPYLADLGIDVIWLSPVYQSPNVDNGYDISDYYDISPEFGTMETMKALIQAADAQGIKIIMDLVVNHTSDQHAWFQAASMDKTSPYRDYYVWRDAKAGDVPNALQSNFGGSAWTFEPTTQQYYLHLHDYRQPDLNWESAALRQEIYAMMNFWLELGIAGFRMDVIELIGKEVDQLITANGPKLHHYIQEMHRETFGKFDALTVGETWAVTPETAKLYCDPQREELSMIFQFEAISFDKQVGKRKWDLAPLNFIAFKRSYATWQTELETAGWNSLFGNNHDLPRMVSRWGNDTTYRVESAKMLATMLHFQKGTPYIYQGEEIGMTNVAFDEITSYQDIETLNMYAERCQQGYDEMEVMRSIYAKSRDNARTPMQWNQQQHAGFTSGQPWLAVNPNYQAINVANDLAQPDSIFKYYQQLIRLRKQEKVMKYGRFELLHATHESAFVYTRTDEQAALLIVCNFSEHAYELSLPAEFAAGQRLISNYEQATTFGQIRPYEATVYKINKGE